MRPNNLCVIGLGAIGGSVARRAAAEGVPRIVGFSRHRPDAIAAAKAGAISDVATSAGQAVRGADLVVLAAPPGTNIDLLETIAGSLNRDAIITDTSSVKASIVERAQSLALNASFAGSHPLAGTHESGFGASRDDLFDGALVYVCSLPKGDKAHDEVVHFWKSLMGGHTVSIEAEQHDRMLAWTSHLPQVVASSLAVALAAEGPRGATYGPGAMSTTRIAASSADMWVDVLLHNREPVLHALRALSGAERELADALEAGNAEQVHAWLERGARWRRAVEG